MRIPDARRQVKLYEYVNIPPYTPDEERWRAQLGEFIADLAQTMPAQALDDHLIDRLCVVDTAALGLHALYEDRIDDDYPGMFFRIRSFDTNLYNVPQKLDHPISLDEGPWGERHDVDAAAAA